MGNTFCRRFLGEGGGGGGGGEVSHCIIRKALIIRCVLILHCLTYSAVLHRRPMYASNFTPALRHSRAA